MGDRGLYKRGDIWYIRFADQNGRIQRESTNSNIKNIAKQLLSVRKAEVAQGKFKKVEKRDKVLFRDYAQVFLRWTKNHRKPRTYDRYKNSVDKFIIAFGNHSMDSIRRQDIENFKVQSLKAIKGATINRDMSCLRKLFNNAIADNVVDTNPLIGIEFFKEIKRSANFLSEIQARSLIANCETQAAKAFIILGLNTGMRYNEILSLKWEQVNTVDRLITLKDTKNNKEDTVPLNKTVTKCLSALIRKGDFVICKEDGSKYTDFRKQWSRAIKKAGLPRCTPHILRHSWATMLVRSGVDLVTLKDLGRWSDLKLVERYSHIANDHRTRMIDRLDTIFETDSKSDTVADDDEKSNR